MSGDTPPTLQAIALSDRTWGVWCDHCATIHRHGAVEGPRVAHCDDGPYRATGYVLTAPPEEA